MEFRVVQEFTLTGGPPTQADTDRLRARFVAAAPAGAAPTVELGLGRMRVVMTFEAADPEGAAARARLAASAVMGGRAVRVDVERARR